MGEDEKLVQGIGVVLIVPILLGLVYRKVMGNTLDGFVYRLKQNDAELTELNLCADGISAVGDDGATQVAAAIARNTTLQSLDLNGMNIGDHGAEKLASVLLLNETLQLIRLHRNKITSKGAQKLAVALRHNHTVTTMYMSSMNKIKRNEINEEIQRLVTLNREAADPKEAAKQKAEMFGPGWVGEGIKLRKKAEEEFAEEQEQQTAAESAEEMSPLLSSGGSGHQKSE